MRNSLITYCLALLGLIYLPSLSSCKKGECTATDIKTYALSVSEINGLHYDGKDTTAFISGSDTSIYMSRVRTQYYNTGSDPNACEGVNRKLEGMEIILKDSVHKDSIFHNQYVSFTDQSTSSIAVGYRGVSFLFDYRYLKTPAYIKTMDINGKTYTGVYTRIQGGLQDSLYYNLENGIIRIVLTSQGKTLQLR
jgi:hypothetical protein